MYIFAKFVADHIFLQNRDKVNIKNSLFPVVVRKGPDKMIVKN
jgi:hypothetical protein